uniref:Retrotransposon gag domain-containing protein n=1 Tax=Periophthalmus magnuspinnatus TaxID=409849 RepID=A0A3B4BH69_9GOBI
SLVQNLTCNQSLSQQLAQLNTQVSALLATAPTTPAAAVSPGATAPPDPRESRDMDPDPYSGQPSLCRGFLFQCMSICPGRFLSDTAKIRYVCGLLRRRALQWAEAKFARTELNQMSFADFLRDFKLVFDHPHYQVDAASWMLSLSQGSKTVADYTIEFWTFAAEVDWTGNALKAVFLKGLNDWLKDELVSHDEPPDLKTLIALTNRIDAPHRSGLGSFPHHPSPGSLCSWVVLASRPRSTCVVAWRGVFVLWREGTLHRHLSGSAKRPGPPAAVGVLVGQRAIPEKENKLLLQATMCYRSETLPISALVDSGAEEDFIDQRVAEQWGITLEPLERPLTALALNGQLLAKVTHVTEPVTLILSGNHHESCSFHVISSPSAPLILGYLWLKTHNPTIDWMEGGFCSVAGWGACSALDQPPEAPDLSSIPEIYHHQREVFSKNRALSLPPHRPYNCTIDLLPGAPLPASRLYNLSKPERETMEQYIRDSLAAGIIRPSSSTVGAGFFFVAKKDKTLRPCIDYQGLNAITVKNKYPLPLLDFAFTPLHGATIFSKLDLRNAYHLVGVREEDRI